MKFESMGFGTPGESEETEKKREAEKRIQESNEIVAMDLLRRQAEDDDVLQPAEDDDSDVIRPLEPTDHILPEGVHQLGEDTFYYEAPTVSGVIEAEPIAPMYEEGDVIQLMENDESLMPDQGSDLLYPHEHHDLLTPDHLSDHGHDTEIHE